MSRSSVIPLIDIIHILFEMSDSDENGNQLPRKRRRYNKLLLDSSINTPLVSRQTLRR